VPKEVERLKKLIGETLYYAKGLNLTATTSYGKVGDENFRIELVQMLEDTYFIGHIPVKFIVDNIEKVCEVTCLMQEDCYVLGDKGTRLFIEPEELEHVVRALFLMREIEQMLDDLNNAI